MNCPHTILGGTAFATGYTGECGFCELEQLRADLTQARLDLANSDAIRAAFVEQSCELAKDMARALSAVEAAYYAGFDSALECPYRNANESYNEWTHSLVK